MTDLLPFAEPLTEEERERALEELWALLARQTELYTLGDSTSVPVETAQALLGSICYTLGFELRVSALSARALLERGLSQALRDGQAHLLEKTKEMRQLWEHAHALAEGRGLRGIAAELDRLAPFFSRYDLYFAAHRTPWDMGLRLPRRAGEGEKGVSSVEAHLDALLDILHSGEAPGELAP